MNPALRRSAAHVFVESLQAPVLDSVDEHHLATVLRLRVGETVSVGDGRGSWRICRFTDEGCLDPDGEIHIEAAPSPQLTIGFAIPKGDRPEWIVQKLTEIGIDRIVVLHADRNVVRWDDARAERQMVRLAKVAREAAMQSRRVTVPILDGPFAPSAMSGNDVAFAEPDGAPLGPSTPTVLIGPEGGWSPAELERSASRCGLASTVLRVETAAIVAAAQLVALRDGLFTPRGS